MATAYCVVWMTRAKSERSRKLRAAVAIVALFLPLAFFKYTDFVYRSIFSPASGKGVLIGLPLPLGVSFVTFTLTAYVVDIYRRKFPAGTSARTVLAYVLFFPHLIAGPILRPDELMPQLEAPTVRWLNPTTAIAIFTLGLVKKLVFADQIATLVDAVYNHPGTPERAGGNPRDLWFLGPDLLRFQRLYRYGHRIGDAARHPTAGKFRSTLLRGDDRRFLATLAYYPFVLATRLPVHPAGRQPRQPPAESSNIVITMALGGLWHGANWTFVIWGVVHGVAVAFVHRLRRRSDRSGLRRMPENSRNVADLSLCHPRLDPVSRAEPASGWRNHQRSVHWWMERFSDGSRRQFLSRPVDGHLLLAASFRRPCACRVGGAAAAAKNGLAGYRSALRSSRLPSAREDRLGSSISISEGPRHPGCSLFCRSCG